MLAGCLLVLSACDSNDTSGVDELIVEDIVVGNGDEAIDGSTTFVHYEGWLYDESAPENKGLKFDSSRDRDKPFSFIVGVSSVIQGWHDGVRGMKVGGQRKLTIPPDLAYGNVENGDIPANSTLIFEIELLEIR